MKKIIVFFIFIFGINVFSLKFDSITFLIQSYLTPDNASKIFSYKENEKKSFLYNINFIGYEISPELSSILNKGFLLTLFDSDFFFFTKTDEYFSKTLITNFKEKYFGKSYLKYFYYKVGKSGVYILFVSDKVPKDSRYFFKIDPLLAIRSFYTDNIKKIKKSDAILLFCDISYVNFRRICENTNFIKTIFNFQNYEQGKIGGTEVYNLNNSPEILNRIDIIYKDGIFYSLGYSKINLEKADYSDFVNRILLFRREK
jgi:hypothetical protein